MPYRLPSAIAVDDEKGNPHLVVDEYEHALYLLQIARGMASMRFS